MTYKDITYEVGENAVRITINRPEVFNAFRTQTVEELILAFRRADEERRSPSAEPADPPGADDAYRAALAELSAASDLAPWVNADTRKLALDATWSALAARWNDAELVELLVVAGFYRLGSGFLNSAGVQLDPGVPGFPTA